MATVTKTYSESFYSSYKSTWTIKVTGYDLNVTAEGQSLKISLPAVIAKYAYSSKSYGAVFADGYIYANGTAHGYFSKYKQASDGGMAKMTSGTEYMLKTGGNEYSTAFAASSLFTSSNPTTSKIAITAQSNAYGGASGESGTRKWASDNNSSDKYNGFDATPVSWGTIGYIYYKVPPTFTAAVTSSGSYYKDVNAYTVSVTSPSAKYGGYITSIKLTLGSQTQELTYNSSSQPSSSTTLSITPDTAGTFTPTVTVTDSRGQTATVSLDSIEVLSHTVGVSSLTAQRIDSSSFDLDDEGTNALLTAAFERTDFSGNYLTEPTVKIDDATTINVTWYTAYTDGSGFSGAVSWSSYAPSSPVTLYGKITDTFSESSSYIISVTPETTYDAGSEIKATLAQSFHLLAGRSGGKGLGIGMKPDSDALYIALEPLITIDTASASGTTDGDLYDAITAKSWENDVIDSGMLKLKELLTKIIDSL